MFALVIVSVLVGAIAQRVTGMGFALVASPALVLLLGPHDGVLVINACGAVSAAIILTRVWRDVDWRRYALLVIPALVAIVPGAIVANVLPGNVLEAGIGVLLIVALTVSLVVTRALVTFGGPVPAVTAGFASGFMNVTAGIGGPAISVYAVLSRWEQQRFAATMQPYFVTIAASSLATKLLISDEGPPSLGAAEWIAIAIALLVGIAAGEFASPRIPHTAARRAVIVIAYAGGITAVVHGLLLS